MVVYYTLKKKGFLRNFKGSEFLCRTILGSVRWKKVPYQPQKTFLSSVDFVRFRSFITELFEGFPYLIRNS